MSEPFPPVIIRPYRLPDRFALREIACDTAERGEPVETFFHDRELVADLLTSYYTDFNPEAVWVAESEGRVVGYLTGAFDASHHDRLTLRSVLPGALARALGRGVIFHADTWRLIGSGLATGWVGGWQRRIPLKEYPAHLHINIRAGQRGRDIGRKLMESFLQQLKANSLPGVHAVARGDNQGSGHFFKRMGFSVQGRQPVVFVEGKGFKKNETVVYVKKLA